MIGNGLRTGMLLAAALAVVGCGGGKTEAESSAESGAADRSREMAAAPEWSSGARVDSLIREGETHFGALYQLTNGGENAEAYFSWDGTKLILQVTGRDGGCDQIFLMPVPGGALTRVSNGLGRCTCAYFLPGDERIVYSSTFETASECPPKPDYSSGYVWPIYPSYEVYLANADGSNSRNLTQSPGYDAEATVGSDGVIVFTSGRDGDLDIYTMDSEGANVRRLTDEPGYDGGAFFSPDGTLICYRAAHPTDAGELADYRELLSAGLIRPGQLDIRVMDRDGSHKRKLTDNGAANFGPYFHPSGSRIIFSSNLENPQGRNFDLFLVDLAGEQIERVTFESSFDGFPMYSPDGRYLVFASNRGAERAGETNIFLAEWID